MASQRYANDLCRDVATKAGHRLQMREHDRLAFALSEYQRRYDAVLTNMAQEGVEMLLVRSPENICYLTGFETPSFYGYQCLILAPDCEPVLIVRRIEEINATEFSWLTLTVPVADSQPPFDILIREVDRLGGGNKSIGVEKGMGHDRKVYELRGMLFTVAEYEALTGAFPQADFVDSKAIVEEARLIKSDAEVEMVRQAAAISDKAMLAGADAIRVGVTENEVAAAVHDTWCRNGGSYTGMTNIVASGPRASVNHCTWTDREIRDGDPVMLEIGTSKSRYCGAIMRNAFVGKPTPRMLYLRDATRDALELAIDMIRPGVACEDVNRACHQLIARAGFGDDDLNRIAYSLGLNFPPDWGEGHILSIQSGETRPLERNMTFHLLPACNAPGEIDISISATICVTEDGCDVLSEIPFDVFWK